MVSCYEVTVDDWRQPFVDYLRYGRLPEDPQLREQVRRRATPFVYLNDTLYRRAYDGVLLRCLDKQEAEYVLRQAHSSECGGHQSGPRLHHQVKRMGYYWPTMVTDAIQYARSCQNCQMHGDIKHMPPELLHYADVSWPFAWWGLDIVGPINPTSSKGHAYILAATDYFSKWAEALALKNTRAKEVIEFIKHKIVYRYGVPSKITTDNGTPFDE